MLGLMGLIALVVLLAGVRNAETQLGEPGSIAYGPADFDDVIDWEAKLSVSAPGADAGADGHEYALPPPPLSEDTYPCSDCHEKATPEELEPRQLVEMHEEKLLDHGSEDRWCFDCHNPDDRDALRLVNGSSVGFEESYKLCGQCHGTIYRDWRAGIHGRRIGYWNGPKEYMLCAHCHDPHKPKFPSMKPLPPPVRPQFLANGRTSPGATP